ncbi:MAG: helix-turn-helix transcriptional regulator [Lachnospiraceae bacterium]|nr:helix-turn-helix transcriptional regulator [Lachnospiraceae bacterium]
MVDFKISLAAARVNAGFTQAEVAEKMHVSNVTVVNWENGKTIPRYATLAMLCQLYKAPIDAIFLPEEST